ncbi:MAG: SBBP repeat-containing protein [Terriglobales bacterium]
MNSLRSVSRISRIVFALILAIMAAPWCSHTAHAAPPLAPPDTTQAAPQAMPPATTPAGLLQPDPARKAKLVENYGQLPLSFEANQGQSAAPVKFLSRTNAYTLFLTSTEAVLSLRSRQDTGDALAGHNSQSKAAPPDHVLRMHLSQANPAAKILGMDELPGKSNYFVGNNPDRWRSGISTFARVKYERIYPGIDLVYYGNQRQLEYDFIVAPGADPSRIAFDIDGASRIRRDQSGDLTFTLGGDEIRWHKPVVYQQKNGERQPIAAEYLVSDNHRVAFQLGDYDATRQLFIDPLIYSTYLGGSGYDFGAAIAVDSAGNAYVTGSTTSNDFPTANAFQSYCPYNQFNGCQNAFVTEVNPTGTALVFSTFLGGSGEIDYSGDAGYGIALDSAGNIYVTGATNSKDFPITKHAFQKVLNACGEYCTNAFVTKFNPSGSALLYSTYFGGSGGASGAAIAVDKAGHAYITGSAGGGLPTTLNAFEPSNSGFGGAFVARFNPKGTSVLYSTYVAGLPGALGADKGLAIAVDKSNHAYITGSTDSNNFPTTAGAFQALNPGSNNAFVTRLNVKGSALMYSSFLGGNDDDYGTAIAVDSKNNAYVTGGTYSANFPVTSGALQTVCGGGIDESNCWDAFVAKVNPKGSALVYSTYLGGYGNDFGYALALDSSDNVYVAGTTVSSNFPVVHPLQPVIVGPIGFEAPGDAFVAKLNPAGSALIYSTFLGGSNVDQVNGIAIDSAGNAYVTGLTDSIDFPTANPLQPARNGADAFIAAITAQPSDVTLFPLHLDFGGVEVGTASSTQVSVLNNETSAALAISSISVTGANSGDFSQTNTCPASLPAGSNCSITVIFTPSFYGNRSAAVTFAGDASAQGIALTGAGQSPARAALR